MANCLQCNNLLYRNWKNPVCKKCRSEAKCECGNKRDWRAKTCKPCDSERSKVSAQKQWQEKRELMISTIIKSGAKRRKYFKDLEWNHFREQKKDKRYFARYWDEAGRYRAVYRYQWVWITTNGAIPAGYVIHHKDGNPTNDDISNLELLTTSDHAKHHQENALTTKWICQQCSKVFAKQRRGKDEARYFCSQQCTYAYARGKTRATRACPTFQAADDYTRQENERRGMVEAL